MISGVFHGIQMSESTYYMTIFIPLKSKLDRECISLSNLILPVMGSSLSGDEYGR